MSNPIRSYTTISSFTLNSNTQYGLTTVNVHQYLDNLQGLSRIIRMWPPQNHVNTMASKWELAQTLDLIAQERTKTVRPKTRLLVDGENILDVMVLKRTHSDAGEHVIVPSDVNRRNWDYLRSQLDVPGSRWMAQSFVELLVKLGEWRVFLIGGKPVYVVHTLKNPDRNTWSWDMARTYYTLEELRSVDSIRSSWCTDSTTSHLSDMLKRGTLLTAEVCNPAFGSMETRRRGEQQFHQFVMDTYDELCKIESKQLLAKSSIGIFVRFDIALIVDRGTSRVTYFVNEVERTQTTTLWSNRLKANSSTAPTGILGYTLAETLYKWLCIITDSSTL